MNNYPVCVRSYTGDVMGKDYSTLRPEQSSILDELKRIDEISNINICDTGPCVECPFSVSIYDINNANVVSKRCIINVINDFINEWNEDNDEE